MDVVAVTGPRACGLEDVPVPRAENDWVVLRVDVTPTCTEYKLYAQGAAAPSLGHEAAGEVAETGRSGRLRIGDRVIALPLAACGHCACCQAGQYIYCQTPPARRAGVFGTYAQYHAKPEWLCYRLPDDVSLEHGGLALCGLGPTFGAMQRIRVSRFDTVLITGMGPVGLGGVINARHRGAEVIAVESHPYRQRLAAALGAEHVLDPTDTDVLERIRELTQGQGVAKAIDCSGNPQAHRLCIDAARRLGQVAFVGECSEDTCLRVSPDLIRKGLTLVGSWNYNLGDVDLLMQVIRAEKAKLDAFVTHRFPLRQAQRAWELQLTGQCGKVLLKPWEDAA